MNSFYHPDLTNVAILPYFPPSVLKKVYIKCSLSHRKLYHQTFSSDFISVSKKTSIPSFLPPCDRSVQGAGSLFLAQQASLFPSSLKITYFGSWFANLQTSHFKKYFSTHACWLFSHCPHVHPMPTPLHSSPALQDAVL